MSTNYNRIRKSKSAEKDVQLAPTENIVKIEQTTESTSKTGVVIAKNGLCLRKGPSKETDIFRVLLYNVIVTILDDYINDEWLHIMAEDGEIGYCMSEFIEVK
jgi:uncharacterized protein YgiM (DUF1202 family)